MTVTPRTRKLLLTIHVASSIGWFGSVAAFIALAVAGRGGSTDLARAAYPAMKVMIGFVIVPFSLCALVTGVIQGLVTPWGLVRHYWVVVKLVLTAVATFLLLQHLTPVDRLSDAASAGTLASFGRMRTQVLAYACGGLVILITAMTLAIYKPPGLTGYGIKRRPARRDAGSLTGAEPQ
jgi:hypothetical protein